MLVKYKNLNNGKITEEKDLFVSQLQEMLPDISEDFIDSVVDCFQYTIFKENELGIVKEGRRIQENVESNIKNFFSEIKKFSQAPSYYKPQINLNLEGFSGENIKFLLRATPEDLAEFSESYDTTIPNISRERICEVTRFIFDAIKEATERGLRGEKCQTQKERIAEETWNKVYVDAPSTEDRRPSTASMSMGSDNSLRTPSKSPSPDNVSDTLQSRKVDFAKKV